MHACTCIVLKICDGGMGKATSYGLVRKSAEGHCSTFSSPTIKSSHVAIAMHLTLCAMLLRCPAMCLLGTCWVGGVNCDGYIAGGMCDPVLISTHQDRLSLSSVASLES